MSNSFVRSFGLEYRCNRLEMRANQPARARKVGRLMLTAFRCRGGGCGSSKVLPPEPSAMATTRISSDPPEEPKSAPAKKVTTEEVETAAQQAETEAGKGVAKQMWKDAEWKAVNKSSCLSVIDMI